MYQRRIEQVEQHIEHMLSAAKYVIEHAMRAERLVLCDDLNAASAELQLAIDGLALVKSWRDELARYAHLDLLRREETQKVARLARSVNTRIAKARSAYETADLGNQLSSAFR